jgi:hypothetical protein
MTRIATGKVSIEGSRRGAEAGELVFLRKENERMKGLMESLEKLKVSLEDENRLLKQSDVEKENIIA